jgi:hypothetical protein
VQATTDSLFKMLIATPIVGGLVLVGLVIGTAPEELMTLEWREMVTTIVTSLLSHPTVLAAFVALHQRDGDRGSLFVFLVKAGSVSVLVVGEREAGTSSSPPCIWRRSGAAKWTSGAFHRIGVGAVSAICALGVLLLMVYLASGAATRGRGMK